MNTSSRPDRPFLPGDIKLDKSLLRACTAKALAALERARGGPDAETVVRRSWPADRAALALVTRGTTAIADTANWGATTPGGPVASFVFALAPLSAAARLIQAGTMIDMSAGPSSIEIPWLDTSVEPAFIEEGEPIPASLPVRDSGELGPAAKLATVIGISGSLVRHGPMNAEVVFSTILREAAARALDGAIFSDTAASSARPAGILNGVTPLVPDNTFDADMQQLADAIGAAGGGSRLMFFASLGRAMKLRILAGAGLDVPVVPVTGLAAGTLIAIDAGAFASGFSAEPEIDVGTETTLHQADPAAEIGATSSPVRSYFQSDSLALRMILPCAWTMRAPGMVQVVEGISSW